MTATDNAATLRKALLASLKGHRDALDAAREAVQTLRCIQPANVEDYGNAIAAQVHLDYAADAILRAIVRLGGWATAGPISDQDRAVAADPRA